MLKTHEALPSENNSRYLLSVLIALASLTNSGPTLASDPAYSPDQKADQTTKLKEQSSSGQVLLDASGNTLMEEVPSARPKRSEKSSETLTTDLSSVNVPVDANGHIVPLINKEAGSVMPFYSQFQESVEPLWSTYPYAFPLAPNVYRYYPYYPGYLPYGWPGQFLPPTAPSPRPPQLSPVSPWFAHPLRASPFSPGF